MEKPRDVFYLVLPIRIKGHDVLRTAGKLLAHPVARAQGEWRLDE